MQTKQYNLTIRALYASCAGMYQEHQKNIMPPAIIAAALSSVAIQVQKRRGLSCPSVFESEYRACSPWHGHA